MKKNSDQLSRRNFLKIAGAGSLAAAGLPALSLANVSGKGVYTNFHFLALSRAFDGLDEHNILMGGHGKITPGNVVGNGSIQHTLVSAPGSPKPILGEGTWKATSLVSWDVLGTYGIGVAGVLIMDINLVPDGGSPFPALLEVVCNIPPGGLFTGKPEGYVLDIGGPPGPFTPFGPPPLGITWFTNAIEPRG
jgi:hypothetical protein